MVRKKDRILNAVRKFSVKGKWDQAALEYKKLVDQEPRNPRLRLRLGDFYSKAGDREAALQEYEFAAQHFTQEEDLIKAIAAHKLIVKLDPSREDAYKKLAELYSQRGLKGEMEALSQTEPRTDKKKPTVPLFADLSPEEFPELVKRLSVHRLPKGEVVIREGEEGASFFVIIDGCVKVVKKRDGQEIILAHLKENDFFGEIALLSGKPRIATVVTTEECELLELTRKDLQEVINRYPRLKLVLKQFYKSRLKDTREKVERGNLQ
ncbi:MAG: cyclic nucleotide-binding domain-containing protein [Candidatus Binatia bacterium]